MVNWNISYGFFFFQCLFKLFFFFLFFSSFFFSSNAWYLLWSRRNIPCCIFGIFIGVLYPSGEALNLYMVTVILEFFFLINIIFFNFWKETWVSCSSYERISTNVNKASQFGSTHLDWVWALLMHTTEFMTFTDILKSSVKIA